jgi:hypothetical protein
MSDTSPTPGNGHASGSHYQPSLAVVLIIVVLFVGATFLMVRSVTPSTASTATTTTTTTTKGSTSARVVKSRVRVQVANGTSITGLAAHYTQELTTQNWDTLPAGNGPTVKSTIVYFHPGYQAAAKLIAKTIDVSSSSVRALGKAKPVTGYATDDVIVVLGPNSGLSS